MATIGFVKKNGAGYEGRLQTLTINAPVRFVPTTPTGPNSPAFRIVSNGSEIGAAWIKTGKESDKQYVSATFDAPELPAKIYANLGQAADQDDEDVFAIIWNRREAA